MVLILSVVLTLQLAFLGFGRGGCNFGDDRLTKAYTLALAQGHSYLSDVPSPILGRAKDPFGPDTVALIPLDTSYFKGHFYLYFGIVPFVALLVPTYLATGWVPSSAASVVVFLSLGYLSYGLSILLISRRLKLRAFWIWAAIVTVIIASGTFGLLSRPAIYEVENSAAFAFLATAIFLALLESSLSRYRRLASIGSAVCAALTIGCRPNYFPAVLAIVMWHACGVRFTWKELSRRRADLLFAFLPVLIIGAFLAGWNFHRFGNPFDFGIKHTVSEDPSRVVPLSSIQYAPFASHRYLLGEARLARYFPFFQGQLEGPFRRAEHQEDSNQVYGVILVSPIVLAGLFAVGRFGFRRNIVGWLFLIGAGNLLFLCTVTLCCYRYPADFMGPFALIAALGVLHIGDTIHGKIAVVVGSSVVVTLVASAFLNLCALYCIAQSVSLYDRKNPEAFAEVASFFNAPVYAWESVFHDGPRDLAIELVLPRQVSFGSTDPILVTGEDGAQDFLFIYYVKEGVIQLGYEASGEGGTLSGYIKANYNAPFRLEVRYGSFLPPDGHRMFKGLTSEDVALQRKQLTVLLNGTAVLDTEVTFHSPRARFFVGRSPTDWAFGARFHGEIVQEEWPLIPAILSPGSHLHSAFGPADFIFLHKALPLGVFEPLLSGGTETDGFEVLLEQLDRDHVRLVYLDSKHHTVNGESFSWFPETKKQIYLSLGSLFPDATNSLWKSSPPSYPDNKRWKKNIYGKVDGTVRLAGTLDSPETSPSSIVAGADSLVLKAGVMPDCLKQVEEFHRVLW